MKKRIALITTIAIVACLCLCISFVHEPKHSRADISKSNEREQEVSHFQSIMRSGNSYALLMALEAEAPESAKAVSYIALFRELKKVNSNLEQLIIESRKLKELIPMNLTKKERVQTRN